MTRSTHRAGARTGDPPKRTDAFVNSGGGVPNPADARRAEECRASMRLQAAARAVGVAPDGRLEPDVVAGEPKSLVFSTGELHAVDVYETSPGGVAGGSPHDPRQAPSGARESRTGA